MAGAARFRLTRRSLAPRWLTEGEGELVGYALDLMKDAFVERLRLGLLARLPFNDRNRTTTAPPDALVAMGRDRRVARGLEETDASYAARLLTWLDDRKTAGNPFALMERVAEYTGPLCAFRTVDARGNWFTREADGSRSFTLDAGNWDWDGVPVTTQWSRFWLIIYPNGLWTEGGDWGDVGAEWGTAGRSWGSTATPDEVASVRAIVADWKPAGTRCVNIILALDPSSFDPSAPEPDGLWARWSKTVDGVQVPARLSTARYWDGT
jgi:hypothetical protein